MENEIKAGDVWWNVTTKYGIMFAQPEAGMPNILRKYLIHNKVAGHTRDNMWEAGGLEPSGRALHSDWKFLYNINDLVTVSLQTLKDEDEEHSS